MSMNFIDNNAIITEYIEFSGNDGKLNKSTLQKWADFLVAKMPYTENFEHIIKLENIYDYKCTKPAGFEQLIQLAVLRDVKRIILRTEVVEWTQQLHDGSGCELIIAMKCDKCRKDKCECDSPEIVVDVDRMWELNHPEFKYGHMAWYYRHGGLGNNNVPISPYHPSFHLIAPGNYSLENHINGCLNLGCKTADKYTIEEDFIRFNFKEGKALISYFAVPLDAEGYRKIPNIPELIEAITWYLHERLSFIEYNSNKNSINPKNAHLLKQDYMEARQEKERFMGIAREKILTQDYASFQRDLGKFYGRFLPQEDICGNVTDAYYTIMNRLNLK